VLQSEEQAKAEFASESEPSGGREPAYSEAA